MKDVMKKLLNRGLWAFVLMGIIFSPSRAQSIDVRKNVNLIYCQEEKVEYLIGGNGEASGINCHSEIGIITMSLVHGNQIEILSETRRDERVKSAMCRSGDRDSQDRNRRVVKSWIRSISMHDGSLLFVCIDGFFELSREESF